MSETIKTEFLLFKTANNQKSDFSACHNVYGCVSELNINLISCINSYITFLSIVP